MSASAIRLMKTRLLPLDQGWYRWVSIKEFSIHSDEGDIALLSALIADRQYKDSYATPLSPEEQQQDLLHGPYWMRAISPRSFVPVAPDTAREALRPWIREQSRPTLERLEREAFSLFDVDSLYQLQDLRSTAEHDWGFVVGTEGFMNSWLSIARKNARFDCRVRRLSLIRPVQAKGRLAAFS